MSFSPLYVFRAIGSNVLLLGGQTKKSDLTGKLNFIFVARDWNSFIHSIPYCCCKQHGIIVTASNNGVISHLSVSSVVC